MFDLKELSLLLANENSDNRYNKIKAKSIRLGIENLSLSDCNYIYKIINNTNEDKYNVDLLKQYLTNAGLSYKWLIKNTGIPRATISKCLNGGRNIKIKTLNKIIKAVNDFSQFKLSRTDLEINKKLN